MSQLLFPSSRYPSPHAVPFCSIYLPCYFQLVYKAIHPHHHRPFSSYVHSFILWNRHVPDTVEKLATYYHYSFTRIIYEPLKKTSKYQTQTKVRFYVDPCPASVRFMRYAPVFEAYRVTNRFSFLFSGAIILTPARRMAAPPSTPSTMAKQHPLMLAHY